MDSPTYPENMQLMPTALQAADTVKEPDDDRKCFPTLKECSPTWIWRVGVHALLVIVPTSYLVLLGIVGDLNGRKQSSLGDDILEILQLASTLWPISFAAVVGPFLKTLALFKAERGATVGSLEFLLTGQTAVAAFKNLFILQYIKIWTMAIIAIWCLSPLGGQAIVRSLSLESNMETTEIPATHYFSQTPLSWMGPSGNLTGDINAFNESDNRYPPIPDYRRRVMAALSGPDLLLSHANLSNIGFEEAVSGIGGYPEAARLGRQDMWHNVRIPFMEYLEGYNADNPKNWTSVPSNEISPFSSFIGVPIRGGSYPRAGNSSMVLQSRYHTLECGDHLNGKDWTKAEKNPVLWLHNNTLNKTELSGPPKPKEKSGYLPSWPGTGTQPSLWLDFLEDADDEQLQLLVFGDCWEKPETFYTGLRICNVSTSYVDVEVECIRLDDFSDLKCQATRIRRSKSAKFSSLDSDLSEYEVAAGILFEMPSVTATYDYQSPSVLEKYIKNPPTAFALEEDDINYRYGACYKDVPKRGFEARLATALNTFIMASYNYSVLTGTDGTSLHQRNDMWHNITATWTEYTDPVYTLHIGWYCISVVSTLILLACTFSNTLIRQIIIAPDFLDSVDGLIRDSPFVKMTDESSDISTAVSSRDRINFTKDMQIQIRDIQPDEDVGKIAITSDIIRSRLDPERVYTS